MWINKDKYNSMCSELKDVKQERDNVARECNEWRAKYEVVTESKPMYMGEATIMLSIDYYYKLSEASEELEKFKKEFSKEITVWKQKYADEVQKRIDLIGQMKG